MNSQYLSWICGGLWLLGFLLDWAELWIITHMWDSSLCLSSMSKIRKMQCALLWARWVQGFSTGLTLWNVGIT